jgi:hypothetical protein
MIAVHTTTTLIATLPPVDEATAASLFDGKFGIHEIEEMYMSYLADIVSQLNRFQKTRVYILYHTPSLQEALLQLFHTPAELRLVGPKETGMIHSPTIERIFKSGQSKSVLILLTLHPLVNYHILGHALRILSFEDESVVIGTLSNQRPYLLGMKSPHTSFMTLSDSEYFDSDAILHGCCSIDALVNPLNTLPAIRTLADLAALREKLERQCEQRHDYPKRTLSLLRQIDNAHMTAGSA